ncbi:PEST proteolytic signal-containing nuclear protein [Takifugu flavidus]|uniref:PEST proteolytic signal-containing nuclear protein n=1 Tax=Takifugu flavidus TaxID=433684 RepID=A0A5C6NJU3_9TELE|nr:PEST proteolytic signal-containing nuclear protein [Takifugu flavidus]
MADYTRKRSGSADDGGPQEEEGRVKTKPVSCSTVGGEGPAVKRTSHHLTQEEDDEDEAFEIPPAPCKISKIGLSMRSQMGKKSNPISIKLGATSEPEEMPPEAKMRMKNIGRETPTSAGPNSFNKGKHGFSDNQRLWERKIKTQAEKS